jgi:hypothetical protein
MNRTSDQGEAATTEAALPKPPRGAKWRWSAPRRMLVGSGVLAAALSLGGATVGASATSSTHPSSSQAPGQAPPRGTQPTTGGRVTGLATGAITISTRAKTTQTVTYSSATTFRTRSGSSSSLSLKVGQFVTVEGTKNADGSVTAKSIMISSAPPGRPGQGPGGRPGQGQAPKNGKPPTG